ncbi:MAG: ATP-binding protein [Bryobacterales bacterium]|nr:ATP-binding protein [Bryobacterales bacterium]
MVRSRELSRRLSLGVILAVALGTLSLVNWVERGRFGVPEDGIMWADSEAGVSAVRVTPNSPAALVGVRPGDILASIEGRPVHEALDVVRILSDVGSGSRAVYRIDRDGERVGVSVVVGEGASRGELGGFLLVLGWSYALIGLLVWTRSPGHPLSGLFYAFCLVSCAVYALSSTGELSGIDRLVYWIDVWALLWMPALLLDFCLRFPDGEKRHGRLSACSYGLAVAVGAAQHAAAGGWVSGGIGEEALFRFFETAPLVLLVLNGLAAASVVWLGTRDTADPVQQLQRRWLGLGAAAAMTPFGIFYVVPFAAGTAPGPNQAFSVLSLAALPLAIAVALFRYRLLDFSLVWRRAIASSVALGLLSAIAAAVLFGGALPESWLDNYGPVVWLLSLSLAAAAYYPVRDWLARTLERRAYRERYQERRTLADFAAELAAETDLNRMVASAGNRLVQTLHLERAAILAPTHPAEDTGVKFGLLWSHGLDGVAWDSPRRIESLESEEGSRVRSFSVAEHSSNVRDGSSGVFGMWHFVPCLLRNRLLVWIGLGRTKAGDLLTSEDVALAETVSSPLAIALENSRLYASLQARATQYQRLKDFNENIVESLSVGIVVLDMEGRVQIWNTQLELALHISRENAVGRLVDEMLPASLVERIDSCVDGSGSGTVHKFLLRSHELPEEFRPQDPADNADRVINLAVAPLVAKGFEPVGRLLIVDDVTERVELEEAVLQADRLSSVGLLAAGVAHEVNTPLAVISTYSQMLADRFGTGSEEAKLLGKMTEQTFRASEIVNSLLDFSRTSGAEMTRCDLNRAISDTLELISPQLRKARVQLELRLDASAIIRANRGKLQQVLLNLFLNARDAMPDGGALRVTTRTAADANSEARAHVLVSDTGIGIEPELQRRIFDPFFTTKDSRRGTGLGLAVSYGIVQEHSGTITVQSTPGAGTTFTLEFPLAEQPVHA